ncbi:MAG: RHS repeat protein, partial [Verrucomicrobia bacterium]|nr:RHS repeat protein [Verrucomicrobiota bacterium]
RSLGKTSPHQPGFITTLLSCRFFYDLYHNVTLEMLEGGLTGIENEKYLDRYTTHYTYSYDGFNLPLSQKDDLQTTINRYKEGTDLLIERKIYEGDQLREEITCEYDDNAALIFKIHRIGSIILIEETKRRADGMPVAVIQSTPSSQLHRTVFHYNERNQVIQTDHFDANDTYIYSLYAEFDERGRIITQTDPFGRKTHITYDPFNNPLTTHIEGLPTEVRCEYDLTNRLVKKSTCDCITGEEQTERYERDKMGRETARITPLGAKITFTRDSQGRILEEKQTPIRTPEGWKAPLIIREYDPLDRVIKEIDPQGGVTEIDYTARGEWCLKKYPDGSGERRHFALNGQLEQEIHKDGSSTRYTRDYKGKILSQQRFDLVGQVLSQETLIYDGDLLLEHTDPRGFTAHYSYNEAGQLLQMRKEDQLTEYTYDAQGRKITELSWSDSHHYLLKRLEYDLLNRIIAEQLEDEAGKVYQRNETTYDLAGNVIRTSTLLSSTTTDYD